MATTFGTRPGDTVADKHGNVVSGVALTLYASAADAAAQVAAITTVTSDASGLWPYTDAAGRALLWARDPSGKVWPVGAAESPSAKVVSPSGTSSANTTALQSAMNDAASAGAPLLVRGAFSIDGQVNVPSGSDIDFSQARITQVTTLTPILVLNNVTGVRLNNLRVQGKTSDYVNNSSVYLAAAVRVTGTTSDVQINGGSLLGVAGAGVYIAATASDVHVLNCRMTGPGSSYILGTTYNYSGGIVTETGATHWEARGNEISGFAQGIVTGDNMQDIRIVDNYIHDIAGQHGIYCETINGGVISGNMIRNCGLLGMKIQVGATGVNDADAITISDNVIYNVGAQGILLTNPVGGTPRLRRVSVTGNVIRTAVGNGIEANNCVSLHIADNIVYDTSNGIQLGSSTSLDLTDNRVNQTTQNGITLTDVTDATIDGNRVIDPSSAANASAQFGITVAGASSDLTIRDNKVTDSTGAKMRYGIYISAGTQSTMDITGNYVSGATDYGARFIAATAVRSYRNNNFSGTLGSVLNPVPATVVDPYGGPGQNGLIGANFDPSMAVANQAAAAAGVLSLAKLVLPSGGVVSTLWVQVGVAGVTLTSSQCFMGVYDASGNLLGTSADLSGVLNSTGNKNINLVTPTAAQPAGTVLYAALLWNGTTAPQIRGVSGTGLGNIALSAASSRWATAGSALTSLPSTLPTLAAATTASWVGVS